MREREERTNRFSGKLKSPRWQSEDRWEEWERRKKEPSARVLKRRLHRFSGNLCFALVTEWRQLRGMGIKWERGKKEPSARVFLWEAQHLILEFSTGSVSTPAEMGCWCGYLEGAISVEKIQKAQSAWIWYKFPHWKIFFIFHKSGFQKPYI